MDPPLAAPARATGSGDNQGSRGSLRTVTLIEVARGASVRVTYVVVPFRAGYPEVSLRNPSNAILSTGRFLESSARIEVHSGGGPPARRGRW
ncbi:MAG: hypothetical protein ABSF69_13030 [Polyangiaceae bacterium]